MPDLQIGVCNGQPVIIDVPASGLIPIVYKKVILDFDFHKDAPPEYRPFSFVNRPQSSPRNHKPWKPNPPAKAGWLYNFMEAEAAALVALGVAHYYVGPSIDVDHRGRPAP